MQHKKRLSLRFRIFRKYVISKNAKSFFGLPSAKIIEQARKVNNKNVFHLPEDTDFHYLDEQVIVDLKAMKKQNTEDLRVKEAEQVGETEQAERIKQDETEKITEIFHCLKTQKSEQPSKEAILYLHGGGMILTFTKKDFDLVKDLCKKTSKDVWAPYYPVCTDYSIDQSFYVVFELYRRMVNIYGAENISVIGFSAGASLALGLGLLINELGKTVPMPAKIISCAPGSISPSEEITRKMEELNQKDFILDVSYMKYVDQILTKGKKIPGYMLGIEGDYSNFPETYLYYGSDEILYAFAPYIMNCFEKANSQITLDVAPGMFHCYMMFHHFPEAKRKWKEIVEKLK